MACKNRHEGQVGDLNLTSERNILLGKRVSSGYVRNAIFYFLVSVLFGGYGFLQYRFLGWQAVFFILIGLFLFYTAATNFLESKKYK
jgi:hypothetical protein